MVDRRPEIAVIADVPADVREALAQGFTLVDERLEGPGAKPLSAIATHYRAVATRAILGVPDGLLDRLPQLGLVLSVGAGTDRIDMAELQARGVQLAYTPDQFTEDVADHALGLIFAAQRRIVEADRFARSGAWRTGRFGNAHRVSNRRVGIVGLGRIGARLAEKCTALGMPVSYSGRTRHSNLSYAFHDDIRALAAANDLLVLACAVTDRTRGIVTAEVLEALGPDGILVNIARGAVVDEAALIDALARRALGGAALDVFANEPGFDPRLAEFDQVILSPHCASFTYEARQAVIDHLASSAARFFAADAESDPPSRP